MWIAGVGIGVMIGFIMWIATQIDKKDKQIAQLEWEKQKAHSELRKYKIFVVQLQKKVKNTAYE